MPNVRVSGVEDALTTIINYPLFNKDDNLSKQDYNLDMSKICDFFLINCMQAYTHAYNNKKHP